MNLRKKCAFSMDKVSDMILLHEDMNIILKDSHMKEAPSPDKFIDDVFVYMNERPNIHKNFSPEKTLREFVEEICFFHLKAMKIHAVMTGKERRKDVIDSLKDEIEDYKEFSDNMTHDRNEDDYERSVAIPTRTTGVVILDKVEEQRKSINESLTRMVDDDSAMA
jgi:hypothetical protein